MKTLTPTSPRSSAAVAVPLESVPAPIPGSAAPEPRPLIPRRLHLKTILVPIDFSPMSEKAVAYAVAFARQFGAKVTLLHVVDLLPGSIMECEGRPEFDEGAIRRDAQERLDMVADVKVPADLRAATRVEWGTPWHEIGLAASALDTDLIILATQGLTGLKHIVLGSTAERVVRHATCPVLVVREKEHEFV